MGPSCSPGVRGSGTACVAPLPGFGVTYISVGFEADQQVAMTKMLGVAILPGKR